MTIIEQIKAEIKRLKGICTAQIKANPGQTFPFVMEMTGYDKLLSFLDTIESEKPMNPSGSSEIPNDLEEAADEYANKHYSEWDESWDDYNGHNVEPENDKLELMDAFIAGAKWISIHGNDIKEL